MRKCVALLGGPYHLHIFTADEPLPDSFRFPAEPARNVHGGPSVCAPRPTPDGPYVYARAGSNFLGDPVYRHAPPRAAGRAPEAAPC